MATSRRLLIRAFLALSAAAAILPAAGATAHQGATTASRLAVERNLYASAITPFFTVPVHSFASVHSGSAGRRADRVAAARSARMRTRVELLRALCHAAARGDLRRRMRSRLAGADRRAQQALRRFLKVTSGQRVFIHRCLALGSKRAHASSAGGQKVWFPARSSRYVLPAYARDGSGRPGHTRSYVVTVAGPQMLGMRAAVVDPVTGRSAAPRVVERSSSVMALEVPLTSYPRLIVLRAQNRTPSRPSGPGSGPPGPGAPPARPPTTVSSTTSTSGSPNPFSPTSPWRTPLPANAPLDPQSPAIVSNLVTQIQDNYGHASLNTTSYSYPIFTVPANQRKVNMTWNNCQGNSATPGFLADLQGVPVPANAFPSGGTDANMIIWQPSTQTDWEFWKAAKDPSTGTWSACWGGKITNVSQNPGIFQLPYGVSASGVSMLASIIRVSEIQSGQIDHAIAMGVPDVRASVFSWPANRTDGGDSNPTDPAEGERFRLNPNLNLSTLNLSPGALAIARAMQTYGVIVTDSSGAVSVYAEDPRPYQTNGQPDPYSVYFPGGQYSWLQSIPWNQLQAVGWNYGQ